MELLPQIIWRHGRRKILIHSRSLSSTVWAKFKVLLKRRLKNKSGLFILMYNCSQKPLPKLPVPELRTTLTRYLGVVAPIVDEETFKRTRRLVHDFIRSGGEGDELQAELKAYAKTQVNWVRRVYCLCWWLYCYRREISTWKRVDEGKERLDFFVFFNF